MKISNILSTLGSLKDFLNPENVPEYNQGLAGPGRVLEGGSHLQGKKTSSAGPFSVRFDLEVNVTASTPVELLHFIFNIVVLRSRSIFITQSVLFMCLKISLKWLYDLYNKRYHNPGKEKMHLSIRYILFFRARLGSLIGVLNRSSCPHTIPAPTFYSFLLLPRRSGILLCFCMYFCQAHKHNLNMLLVLLVPITFYP